jgi:small subunit ribosomal protein S16
MLKIRLQRIGKKGQAHFRVVVTEHTTKPKGEYLELLGSYNPHQKELKVKKERIDYWVSKGAQPSPTVNNLLVNNKIWDKPKMASWKPKVKETKEEEKPKVEVKKEIEKPTEEPKQEKPKQDKVEAKSA